MLILPLSSPSSPVADTLLGNSYIHYSPFLFLSSYKYVYPRSHSQVSFSPVTGQVITAVITLGANNQILFVEGDTFELNVNLGEYIDDEKELIEVYYLSPKGGVVKYPGQVQLNEARNQLMIKGKVLSLYFIVKTSK